MLNIPTSEPSRFSSLAGIHRGSPTTNHPDARDGKPAANYSTATAYNLRFKHPRHSESTTSRCAAVPPEASSQNLVETLLRCVCFTSAFRESTSKQKA